MYVKILEIRDRATYIAVLCIDMNHSPDAFDPTVELTDEEAIMRYYLRTAGYPCDGVPMILMTPIGGKAGAYYDPFDWANRSYHTAHLYITANWDSLQTGDVVDVEFILGEKPTAKISQRFDQEDQGD